MFNRYFSAALLLTVLHAIALPALAEDHKVGQKNRAFDKAEITVKKGDTITFQNADDVVHNVFSTSPAMAFDIKRQAPGGSSTVTFTNSGDGEVRCSIHPKMKLKVVVKE